MGLTTRHENLAMSLPEPQTSVALAALGKASAPAAPPAVVVGANVLGAPTPGIINWLTVLYLVLICLHFIWKWVREARGIRNPPRTME